MKILLLGSGAREHALALSLSQTGSDLVIAPGNPGTAELGENRSVNITDPVAVSDLARLTSPDLVVIGPEAPLVAGVADAVRELGIPVFGPSAAAARLEGSKAFAKQVMAAAAVPTAMAHLCTSESEVTEALDAFGAPYVVKDDGLAAGKGVVVTDDRTQALQHALDCLAKPDGAVVIEEYLDGPEVSLFCISDGNTVRPLAPAQDFKRLSDGDNGPNTGGMGAYSPLAWAPDDLTQQVVERVAQPTIDRLAELGSPFVGLLYCGLAVTSRGLRVIEFNARFGDPETQVVLARLSTPLDQLLLAAATGDLDLVGDLRWKNDAAVTVVIAAPGYPGTVHTGGVITGVDAANAVPGAWVLHAGTAERNGDLVSAGGRVLSVVGIGASLSEARDTAYRAAHQINLDGAQYRTDIAASAVQGALDTPAAPK